VGFATIASFAYAYCSRWRDAGSTGTKVTLDSCASLIVYSHHWWEWHFWWSQCCHPPHWGVLSLQLWNMKEFSMHTSWSLMELNFLPDS
jgi:hypothetical protein